MSCVEAAQHFLTNAKAALSNLENAIAELQDQEKRLSQEKEELQQERTNIEHARQQVETDRDQLETEKAIMMKNGVGPNNLVGLNFRGEKTVVMKRSVLCQIESSMMAAMFSGGYEKNLDLDKDGNVYIGYPPSVMMPFMDWLTALQDAPPDGKVPDMNVPPGHQDVWDGAVKFFGLESLFSPPRVARIFSGVQRNLKMSDLPGWHVALCKPGNEHTTEADFNLPGIPEDSHVLIGAKWTDEKKLLVAAIGAKRTDEDELLVAAIGRRDFIREVIATRGWNQHHNDVYWGFTGNFFYLGASPLADHAQGSKLSNMISGAPDVHMVWSCTDGVFGSVFEKLILVPFGE